MKLFDALRERKSEKKFYGRRQGRTTTFVYHMFRELMKDQSTDIIAVGLRSGHCDIAKYFFKELLNKTSLQIAEFQDGFDLLDNNRHILCSVKFMNLHKFASLRGINPNIRVFIDPDILETRIKDWR